MTGIGNSHIQVTALPEAQIWFDQGLSLLHDFWGYESTKAFEQSVRTDPNCAMCYWGLFKILYRGANADNTYALAALADAKRLSKHLTRSERLYIAAADAELDDSDSGRQRQVQIFQELIKHDPNDVEASVFLAIALDDGFTDDDQPKPGTKQSMAVLQNILHKVPNDSAANHYWIHAVERSSHPEQALQSARLVGELAPNSGHMVHMPGHIYFRLGDYAEAERWFAASTEVDEHYMQDQHVSPDDDWNYVHNLMYSITNLMEEGKFQAATTLSGALPNARGHLSASLYPWLARDQITRINDRLPVALRTGDWKAALELLRGAPRPAHPPHLRMLAEELTSFCAGMDALDRNDLTEANSQAQQLDALLWRMQSERTHQPGAPHMQSMPNDLQHMQMATVSPDADLDPILKNMSVASLELRAGLLLLKADTQAAKETYARAMKEEHQLGYHEPPFYIRPVGETEGSALIQAHDYVDAKAAFLEALRERPHSGLALFGVARCDELAGDKTAAKTDYEAFLQAWANADRDASQVPLAKAALANLG